MNGRQQRPGSGVAPGFSLASPVMREPAKPKPHYHGHRARLRARLLEAGADALPDYELLEFLLAAAHPRGDTKPLAKELLRRFGGLAGVLGASRAALEAVPGMGGAAAAQLLAVRAAAQRMVRGELTARPVIGSWDKLVDYCTTAAGFAETEEFRLLFLDRKNGLIADERQQHGTVDHVPVYPREVVKRALELGASAIIMVHNHPSGDPTPSAGDIEMTHAVAKAAGAVGVTLHDHVVIGRGKHASFKSLGLL
ncbi:MAG: DNA repair protein RadC [Alphaproteobacteria bacterium]|nr:DNA repair protein RadC [Alphaproteobacteria bacterium]